MQQKLTVCINETVTCVIDRVRKETKNLKTLLKISSRNGAAVLVKLVAEDLEK